MLQTRRPRQRPRDASPNHSATSLANQILVESAVRRDRVKSARPFPSVPESPTASRAATAGTAHNRCDWMSRTTGPDINTQLALTFECMRSGMGVKAVAIELCSDLAQPL